MNALSPVTARVLAATALQQSHRKSRLQHVTMADTAASPSGLPQASPSLDAAPVADPHQDGSRQTPQVGSRHTPQGGASAVRARACTPQTARGCAYMTPPTGSAQRPAVSHPCFPLFVSHMHPSLHLYAGTCRYDLRLLCSGLLGSRACLASLFNGVNDE